MSILYVLSNTFRSLQYKPQTKHPQNLCFVLHHNVLASALSVDCGSCLTYTTTSLSRAGTVMHHLYLHNTQVTIRQWVTLTHFIHRRTGIHKLLTVVANKSVVLHHLSHTVCELWLCYVDENVAVLLQFIVMMQTGLSAVQVTPKISLEMSPN